MFTEATIVAIAFILFFVVLFRPIKRFILEFLDAKIQLAIRNIEEAAQLRSEAEGYLRSAQAHLAEAKTMALDIVNKAQEKSNLILSNVEDEVKILAEQKTENSLARLSQHENQIIEELKAEAVELAMVYVQDALVSELKKEAQMNLIEDSLKKTKKLIH
jgi:F-type H+-transporting ATPase subunit b